MMEHGMAQGILCLGKMCTNESRSYRKFSISHKLTNMKEIFLAASLLLTQWAVAQSALHVRPEMSKVIWTGTKISGQHQGTVKLKEGNVILKNQKLIGGYFVMDMTTITCTDIPDSDPIPKKRLENHLKDADFFDVKKSPTARFDIVEVASDPANQSRYLVTGNLTIKGITKQCKLVAEPITQTNFTFVAKAVMYFNRQQFGVAYSGIQDELVHDRVKLEILVKAQ